MLDSETKKRIDDARNMLVGKVPDPKAQVEQITIALIYKFMDDMDAESEELGGKRKFFTGDFAQFGWAKLMRPGLGGHETLKLYAEGIAKIPENPGIPSFFRDVFKNAFLPYRDPETLKSFLKIIDEFTYDHSERLGDAFEYLLSVLGSQGNAGQFRTPRHIIDFMIQVVDPKKDETILDPACGTAGFLISSYKHILKANTDKEGNSKLTPDEKGRLAQNFKGYDISPDMVRLSLVNLYLHGFSAPSIDEYDTLTSEDKWDELADVVLANPPFMSPMGGIKPHKRFSVQSKRSEVLFVDYMAEHLTPKGRAAIIVPEGIIFQSQNAYKQLRKMLVENYLVAVVSLPAGVFNPYSGVKTSILILDKSLAKQSNTIGFFKIENDGFDLGAQRRKIDKDNLPQTLEEIAEYFELLRSGKSLGDFEPSLGLITPKEKVAENGEYNLSGERYRVSISRKTHFPIVGLGEVCNITSGQSPPGESYNEKGDGVPFYQGKTEFGSMYIGDPRKWTTDPQRFAEASDILMSVRAPVGPVNLSTQRICIGRGLAAIKPSDRLLTSYVFRYLRSQEENIKGNAGAAFSSINSKDIKKIQIPLPPLEIQKEIVAEIEGYQKVIDGARAVVENYRPHIVIDPEWPIRDLASLAENLDSRRIPITKGDRKNGLIPYYGASGIVDHVAEYIFDEDILLISEDGANLLARSTPIAFSVTGKCWVNNHAHVLRFEKMATQRFVEIYINSISINKFVTGAAQPKLNQQALGNIPIPIPDDIKELGKIIKDIEREQSLVSVNWDLIDCFEKKIQATIARIWSEGESAPAKEDVLADV